MTRILIAGIGNIFLGDDGFGVEVAQRLQQRSLPDGVEVGDFGIRGMDLAYSLLEEYDALIMLDAAARGEPPGTLYLIEVPADRPGAAAIDTHGMDPVKVLNLAGELGAQPIPAYVIACEPEVLGNSDEGDMILGLSEPVAAAVDEAVAMVESLTARISGGIRISS